MITARALFLADGPSDEPLGEHVRALAAAHGVRLDVVTPDFRRMDSPPGLAVHERLACMLRIDPDFDVLLVHRDAEKESPEKRVEEIDAGLALVGVSWPRVPIVPVRMTEAWVLLDEQAIREVAGRPTGSMAIGLPSARRVEGLPDPKASLVEALATASGLSGRRLKKFKRDFPAHRAQLLTMLDRKGPVKQLSSWQALEAATAEVMQQLVADRGED